MAARFSALRAGRFLPPERFLVLISVGGWVDARAIVRLGGLGNLKKFTSSGTRTGDLPACSIVPQPNSMEKIILETLTEVLVRILTFYGTQKFITLLTTARHCSISWARWIRYTAFHPIPRTIPIIYLYQRLGFSNALFPYKSFAWISPILRQCYTLRPSDSPDLIT
jgi:hypothetical protein